MTPNFVGDEDNHELDLSKINESIDWSSATSLIKYEGIYLFGGRDRAHKASNRLFCIQVEKRDGVPDLKVLRLETSGLTPPARYAHAMTYFKEKSLITISGGRND